MTASSDTTARAALRKAAWKNPTGAAVRAEAQRLLGFFEAAGAVPVEADLLQPSARLLDLYGEDIRARAYVTSDPVRGELMLRPDFTLPVVEAHMAEGADPARYCYVGEVFRRQEEDDGRASEFLQVGYELFDGAATHEADAEVFSLFAAALGTVPVRAVTGDIGFLAAAVRGLSTSDVRKNALLRHIWRPHRFRALLERFAGRVPMAESRKKLLADPDPLAPVRDGRIPLHGLRSEADIAARINALKADAETAPISGAEVDLLSEILSLELASPAALAKLREIGSDLPAIRAQTEVMARRLDALAARGIAVDDLAFEASHGRSAMEYYDGFVFSFHALNTQIEQPIATGGRYDALTKVLGQGQAIPAVGGVIRPDLALQAQTRAASNAALGGGVADGAAADHTAEGAAAGVHPADQPASAVAEQDIANSSRSEARQ